MSEPLQGSDPGTPAMTRSPAEWLRGTFAGLTLGRVAILCFIVTLFALSRPPVKIALFKGQDLLAIARAAEVPIILSFLRFIPTLLLVVAAVNRGPRTNRWRILWIGGALLAGNAIGTALMALALPVTAPQSGLARLIDLTAPASVQALHWAAISLTDVAMSVVATAFWYFFRRNAETAAALDRAQLARERGERERAEARVALMQAQVEPHFLFNSLASIRRLYETDPGAGRRMLRDLSSYLAASLPSLRATRSTLEREVALAVAYLNVQKIRMGQRLAVEVDVPARLHELEVPPMMLATLVENAIVHGVGPLTEGGRIGIRACTRGERLVIEVTDTGRGLRDAWGPGVGLANIGARLQSEFGARASVNLASAPDRGVVATLELPLPASAQALAA